jgi:hypothetical protein
LTTRSIAVQLFRELRSGGFLTTPEHRWKKRPPLGDQCPITRTDGSLTKAPGVVNRPVQSISRRSMIRTGETVVVPIGCSFMRCGISEPVTKTVRSSTVCLRFGACLTLGSADIVPANMLAAMRIAALFAIGIFTTNKLHPGSCGVQIIEAITMIPCHKSKRGNGCCRCLSADLTKPSVLEPLR